MHILITNDDGINASGIRLLSRELKKLGQVSVAAPDQEQSGAGHGLTVRQPLRAFPVDGEDWADQAWTINGTPADCTKLAISQLLEEKPDLVVSGINHGYNLGTDTLYSGTVAGALEGYICGVPAIAISVTGSMRRAQSPGNFQLAATLTAEFAQRLVAEKRLVCLNINVPGHSPEEVKGWRYTHVGWRGYDHSYERRSDPFGKEYYWLYGEIEQRPQDPDADVMCCAAGYASVSPLGFDLTDYQELARLQG